MAEKRKLPPGVSEAFRELMENPISFFPAIGRLCGSAAAGLMLCQAIYWSGEKSVVARGGWFWKTAAEWEEETCLSSREQRTAREIILQKGFWEEQKHKINGAPTLHFRVDFDAITGTHIAECEAKMESAETTNQATNGKCGNDKSIENDDSTNEAPDLSKKEIDETTNLYIQRLHSETTRDHTETPTAEPFSPNGNGSKPNSSSGLAARLEAIRQSRAEQKPLYRAERLLLPTETDEGLNATEVAWAVCGEMGRRGDADRIAMEGAVVAYRVKYPAKNWEQCAEELMAAWLEYEKTSKGAEFKYGFRGFFDTSHYLKREEWAKGPKQNGVDENGGYFDGDVYVTKEGKRLPGYVPPPSARRQAQ